jgi:hypothetical protein
MRHWDTYLRSGSEMKLLSVVALWPLPLVNQSGFKHRALFCAVASHGERIGASRSQTTLVP